jgi:hypothetical protein
MLVLIRSVAPVGEKLISCKEMPMSVIDLVRVKEREGVRLSTIAANAQIDYPRLWRACRGGHNLHPSELERLQKALDPVGTFLRAAV